MAKEPKILLGRIQFLFGIVCFLLAVYMTVILIGRYRKNTSATSIAYQKYAKTFKDRYPTFSICLKGAGLYRYNGSAIFSAYGINPRNYELMLEGKTAFRYDYDHNRGLYKKTDLPLEHKTDLTFDNMVKRSDFIGNFIKESYFEAANKAESIFYGNKEHFSYGSFEDKPPFYISYQTSKAMCFTRKSRDKFDLIKIKDHVYLDLSLPESSVTVQIFVHYPGQLLRNLDTPVMTSDSDHMKNKGIQFKIAQTTLLRKRSVKEAPCISGIDDYDVYVQEAVSNKIGCIPPFWMHRLKPISNLNECTSPKTLMELNGYIEQIDNNRLDNISRPCIDMFNSIAWNSLPCDRDACMWQPRPNFAFIAIVYVEKYYEEITQVEDFGFHDFISNLGGFIGIFLGYSMMQIPGILGKPRNFSAYS